MSIARTNSINTTTSTDTLPDKYKLLSYLGKKVYFIDDDGRYCYETCISVISDSNKLGFDYHGCHPYVVHKNRVFFTINDLIYYVEHH